VDTPLLELRSIENVFPPRPERRLGPTALEVTVCRTGKNSERSTFTFAAERSSDFPGSWEPVAPRSPAWSSVSIPQRRERSASRDAPAPIRTAEDGMKRGMAMLSEDRERFRRFARPSEVAFAAMFLASEAAAMITGTNLVIDGEGAIR
jgi:hypothetical protein